MAESAALFTSKNRSSDPIRIDDRAQEKLVQFARYAFQSQDDVWSLRTRLEQADRNYLRQIDFTEEQRKAQAANKSGDPTKLQNMIVPMVLESVENGASFLTQVFLTEYPMFKFGSGPEMSQVTMMWNTLVGEDQIHYGWAAEFNKAFRNAEKYNFSPILCDWKSERKWKPVSGNGANGVALEQVLWEGNCIESIDPYNVIYDTSCPISKCHIDGEFVGYVELMSRTKLKRFIHSLGEDRLKNDVKAYESPNWDVIHYTPDINIKAGGRKNIPGESSFNWAAWVTDEAQQKIKYRNGYTVLRLYARIMPYEFGIRAPMDQTPDIWKLIIVNGVLVYARPMTNAHDLLPLILVQSQVDNLDFQTESNAETQEPFQQMVSALWNAKLQSSRRRVTDRMLYNPLLIDPDHINSPNPSAKIPIRPGAYMRKLEEAVYKIPFDDANSQYWLQEVQGIAEWGLRAQGHNRVSAGQFQKGNKLESEFKTVMANAGSRDRSKAIMWEVYGMHPIKMILKSNYLQYIGTNETRYNRAEKQEINIDPVELRKAAGEFEVGDGLMPIERLIDTDTLAQAFQLLSQDPSIAAEFNKADLFTYLMEMKGADKLSKFKKPKEQAQFEQTLGAWQSVAVELGKKVGTSLGDGKFLMPEDIQKIIGPAPQPPQQSQPGQPQIGAQNANPAT